MAVAARIRPYDWPEPPKVGDLVYDSAADRVGEVRDRDRKGIRFWLRPQGGGTEWIAVLKDLHPADHADKLSAKVAEINSRNRWEL